MIETAVNYIALYRAFGYGDCGRLAGGSAKTDKCAAGNGERIVITVKAFFRTDSSQ